MNLSGKVAIVTGASRGIGRAIALTLSKQGASIAITYSKDEEGAAETLRQINAEGGYAITKCFDVSEYGSCLEAVEAIYKHFGRIDILVNNAGISSVGLFIDSTEEERNRVVSTNLNGVFNMTHCVLSYMLKAGGGAIVNISSIWGVNGSSCESIYSATKGAVLSFTKAIAKEMGPSNVRVNAVAPGVINTKMNNWLSIEEKNELTSDIPLGIFGEPSDIGNTVAFLCSNESKYITGQTLIVDGGFL